MGGGLWMRGGGADTHTTDITATATEATEGTTVTPTATATVTTARGPLMLSPPSSLEPAEWCPPPLLSSTTPPSSLTSLTPPIPWPTLAMPPTPWPTMVSPSSLLQLLLPKPWLLRGRRERLRLTLRSSSTVPSSPTLLPWLLPLHLPLLGLLLIIPWSSLLSILPPRSATRSLPTPSLLLLITDTLTGVDLVLFLSGPGDQSS